MVRVGIAIPQVLDGPARVSDLRDWLFAIDALAFSSIWTLDSTVAGPSAHKPLGDGLHLLTFAAALTTSVQLGIAVVVLPHRLPLLLAKELATLDQLSTGRVVLGVGVGGRDAVTGLSNVPTLGPRARVMEESIQILREAWAHPHDASPVCGSVLPETARPGGPAIWIGGTSRLAIERAARLGDGWIGSGSTSYAAFVAQVATLREHLAVHGRTELFPIAKRVRISVGSERVPEATEVTGSVDACLRDLRALVELGATELILEPVTGTPESHRLLAELAFELTIS